MSGGNQEVFGDEEMLTDFLNAKTIQELVKESGGKKIEGRFEPFCVQTVSVMTAGHALTIMLTMGDSSRVQALRNDASTGIFYPTFNNKSELYQYSASGTATHGNSRWQDVRPLVPFSPIFIKPKCGVCGLQASVGLNTMKANTDTTMLSLPFTMQLQTALEIKNYAVMKKLVSMAENESVRAVGGNWTENEFTALGFSGFERVTALRTTPVVIAHDEENSSEYPLAGAFIANNNTLDGLFKTNQ